MIDCEMNNNLDDQFNINCSHGYLRKIVSDDASNGYIYATDKDLRAKAGDEILFVDYYEKTVQNAYLKKIERVNNMWQLTLDRQITGLKPGAASGPSVTVICPNESSSKSAIIRNCVFKHSRRYPLLIQSNNVMVDGNRFINSGGSAMDAGGEIDMGAGPFPNYLTFRNNSMKYDGINTSNGVVYVHVRGNTTGDPALVSDVLIENNVIDAYSKTRQIAVESVDGLWLKNNTIKCSNSLALTHTPVIVSNSRIEEIDGIYIDYTANVNAAVTVADCEVDKADIKNIEFISANTGKPYIVK